MQAATRHLGSLSKSIRLWSSYLTYKSVLLPPIENKYLSPGSAKETHIYDSPLKMISIFKLHI